MTERDLAAYYDREGAERANRDLAPGRHDARDRFLATHASSGQRSLEIGCGPGRDLQSFVEAGLDAYGIDLSSVFAQLAAPTGGSIANATARMLPFADNSFDIVWSMSVLMHLPDDHITDALDEIRRVLASGGVACIGVWGQDDKPRVLEGRFGPRFFANRSQATWQPLLERIGTVAQYEVWETEGDGFTYPGPSWRVRFSHGRRAPSQAALVQLRRRGAAASQAASRRCLSHVLEVRLRRRRRRPHHGS